MQCVHCSQVVIEAAKNIARTELRRLQDHLLGCPAALAACAPALPVFDRGELMNHFRREEPRAG
jgi:hypothetical protein